MPRTPSSIGISSNCRDSAVFSSPQASERGAAVTRSQIRVHRVSEAEINEAVKRALKDAGVTLPALRRQAKSGRFASEEARLTWFAISPFVGRQTRQAR